ncbi:MAG TPA: hypothetical protein VF820_07040 [Patescibacteria group bacterium]
MPTPPSRESQLTSAFAAFADAQTVRLQVPTQQVPLREALAAFAPLPLNERLLAVFEVHPFPLNPAINRLQYADYQEAAGLTRTSLQRFSQALETKTQDVEALGNGVLVTSAIHEVLSGQMYKNMGDFSGREAHILLYVYDQMRVNLAVMFLENVTDAGLSALYRAVPGLEQTLRGMPSQNNLRLAHLASGDYPVMQALRYIDTRTKGSRSIRRTQMMPVAPKRRT